MRVGEHLRLDYIHNETGKESFYGHCVGDIGVIIECGHDITGECEHPVVFVAGRETSSYFKPGVCWDDDVTYTNITRNMKLKALNLL